MNDLQTKQAIEVALKAFASRPLAAAATDLFASLGYTSKKRLAVSPNTGTQFLATFGVGKTVNDKLALTGEWRSADFLFQLTDDEILAAGSQQVLFDSKGTYNGAVIESYLFLALELKGGYYTRTALAGITRELNKLFAMPALVLFRHGDTLTLAVVNRRLHKRDQTRDVLEKVTLIKDITFADPVRAHLEILNDFALTNLDTAFGVSNFVALHAAWQKRLGSYALSNAFYREIADWYFWAHHQVHDGTIRLPQHCDTEEEKSLFLIRLLTRIIFCWFLVEKRLLPAELFRDHPLRKLLKDLSPSAPTYYHAVLQNLFFGTLNMPAEQRGFREKKKDGHRYDKNFGITNLWRYEGDFRTSSDWTALATRVPFLNGGLFDCLDDKSGQKKDNFILDGFSDNPRLACHLPNELFFGSERTVDLSKDYGDEDKRAARSKKAKVRGLVEILSRYKFTIEENTPLEEEIALDPELLGKVFENLLASYNEDTRTTARKALGAFYTPREVVAYMVDEALKSYLATQVPRVKGLLDDLFSNKATLKDIKPDQRDSLIAAIGRVKILDPACGSGAFPMGALHRLVDLLKKLDPNNESWKRDRLAEARRYRDMLEQADAPMEEVVACDERIADIEKSFDTRLHALDFARKLYLIEDSIYGVDIQPVAVQIAKLRFFIALVVDQKVNEQERNLGVRPLPNLETRLVAADILSPIDKAEGDLFSGEIDKLRADLARIRHEHFNARDPRSKRKWRDADAAKRLEIAQYLERGHTLRHDAAAQLASWDPYDQNAFAPFFDSQWMFGLDRGFDVVTGNPPYVRQEKIKHLKPLLKRNYENTYTGTADLYVYFYERALQLLRDGGILSYISSNSFLNSGFGAKLRRHLATTTSIQVLIDFAEANVFTAITEPCIVIAKKEQVESNSFKALRWDEEKPLVNVRDEFAAHAFAIPQNTLSASPWQIEVSTVRNLIGHISEGRPSLRTIVNDRNFYGVKTGLNDAFLIDGSTREHLIHEDPRSADLIRPYLRGRDMRPWTPFFADQWMIFTRHGTDIDAYPAIKKHLLPFKAKLQPKPKNWPHDKAWKGRKPGSYKWYEIQDNVAYFDEFSKPKIIYQEINRTDAFAHDDRGLFLNNKLFMLPEAPLWLLGILNSRVAAFYLHGSTGVPRGGFLALQWPVLAPLPVAVPDGSQARVLVALVQLRICLNDLVSEADRNTRDPLMLAYCEQILNGLVYELYFPEEVRSAGLRLFELVEQAALPALDAIPEGERLAHLRRLFEILHGGAHPLKIALQKLQTLDTVRVIEGKA